MLTEYQLQYGRIIRDHLLSRSAAGAENIGTLTESNDFDNSGLVKLQNPMPEMENKSYRPPDQEWRDLHEFQPLSSLDRIPVL